MSLHSSQPDSSSFLSPSCFASLSLGRDVCLYDSRVGPFDLRSTRRVHSIAHSLRLDRLVVLISGWPCLGREEGCCCCYVGTYRALHILVIEDFQHTHRITTHRSETYQPTQPCSWHAVPSLSRMDLEKKSAEKPRPEDIDEATGVGEVLNASGHKQELERNFSLLSICAIGITTGNVWAALGGSIVRLSPLVRINGIQDANLA